jgi:DNA-3-methyladenine glycosylase I
LKGTGVIMEKVNKKRCGWADVDSELYLEYHDTEWGVPVYEDGKLFEMFLLETFQAGLSWITILKKREDFRKAFDHFDPVIIAGYDDKKITELLDNRNIIRNRLKINAAITNSRIFLQIQKEFGSFSEYLWSFTGHEIIKNQDNNFPTRTELSDRVSKDMQKRGMKFVGSVTIYSYLQAIGIVNDHETECFRYPCSE